MIFMRFFNKRPKQYRPNCSIEVGPQKLGERLWYLHQFRDMSVQEILDDISLTAKTHGYNYQDVRFGYISRNLQEYFAAA